MPSTASGTALLIAARTCSSFGRTASGCAAMYSSTDLGTLCFISLILCFGVRQIGSKGRKAAEARAPAAHLKGCSVNQAWTEYVRSPYESFSSAERFPLPCARATTVLRLEHFVQ